MEKVNLNKYIRQSSAFEIIKIAASGNFPFAFWKLPHNDDTNLIINLDNTTEIQSPDLEELQSGFLFAPFEYNDQHKSHLIKADLHFRFSNSALASTRIDPSLKHSSKLDDFLNQKSKDTDLLKLFAKNECLKKDTDEAQFKAIVSEAISSIRSGSFLKVVPSRMKLIGMNPPFDFKQFIDALCKQYPNAFVYLVSIPHVGTWLGATPENLISIDKDNIFKTTALAGTQPYYDDTELADAAWRQKEIEEQAMVSRYIIDCFKKIRLREFEEAGPRTSRAGNLMHLKTDFKVNINEVNFPQLGSVMLKLLHPTSAVCGTPKEPALSFINDHEKFDRSYFSGYLGPNKINDETHLFVNLRCMQLLSDNKAMLYAGAGVTTDSDPEKEWQETELKTDTLLKVIKMLER